MFGFIRLTMLLCLVTTMVCHKSSHWRNKRDQSNRDPFKTCPHAERPKLQRDLYLSKTCMNPQVRAKNPCAPRAILTREGRCVRLLDNKMTWHQAADCCQVLNMTLFYANTDRRKIDVIRTLTEHYENNSTSIWTNLEYKPDGEFLSNTRTRVNVEADMTSLDEFEPTCPYMNYKGGKAAEDLFEDKCENLHFAVCEFNRKKSDIPEPVVIINYHKPPADIFDDTAFWSLCEAFESDVRVFPEPKDSIIDITYINETVRVKGYSGCLLRTTVVARMRFKCSGLNLKDAVNVKPEFHCKSRPYGSPEDLYHHTAELSIPFCEKSQAPEAEQVYTPTLIIDPPLSKATRVKGLPTLRGGSMLHVNCSAYVSPGGYLKLAAAAPNASMAEMVILDEDHPDVLKVYTNSFPSMYIRLPTHYKDSGRPVSLDDDRPAIYHKIFLTLNVSKTLDEREIACFSVRHGTDKPWSESSPVVVVKFAATTPKLTFPFDVLPDRIIGGHPILVTCSAFVGKGGNLTWILLRVKGQQKKKALSKLFVRTDGDVTGKLDLKDVKIEKTQASFDSRLGPYIKSSLTFDVTLDLELGVIGCASHDWRQKEPYYKLSGKLKVFFKPKAPEMDHEYIYKDYTEKPTHLSVKCQAYVGTDGFLSLVLIAKEHVVKWHVSTNGDKDGPDDKSVNITAQGDLGRKLGPHVKADVTLKLYGTLNGVMFACYSKDVDVSKFSESSRFNKTDIEQFRVAKDPLRKEFIIDVNDPQTQFDLGTSMVAILLIVVIFVSALLFLPALFWNLFIKNTKWRDSRDTDVTMTTMDTKTTLNTGTTDAATAGGYNPRKSFSSNRSQVEFSLMRRWTGNLSTNTIETMATAQGHVAGISVKKARSFFLFRTPSSIV